MTHKGVVTIERHIIEEERQFPEATGAFSNILYDLAFAAKMIGREVRRAGLADVMGYTGCLLYTSPSPRDLSTSRMPSSA